MTAVESLDQVLAADRRARSVAGQWLTRRRLSSDGLEVEMSALYMIVGTLVALGVLVTFHEFGHFWVARRCG